MTEQDGELSAVARRRLNELLSQPGPSGPSQPDTGDAEPGQELNAEWITSLREAGTESDTSPGAASAPTASGTLPQWLTSAWTFTREHLVTVAVILVVGVLWTGYSLFQARTTSVADAVPRTEASVASPAARPSPASAGSAAPNEVVVHVIGAVRQAGVYRLAEGSRVADAIAAAGGLSGKAAPGDVNMAEVLSDGVQLKIGTRKHPGGWLRTGNPVGSSASGGADAASAQLSINTATEAQLDMLPGVGPVTAAKIVAWRTEHGSFTALTELQEVDGIGPKTYADLAQRVRL